MKTCGDTSMLRKSKKRKKKQKKNIASFSNFRKRFLEYQRTKNGKIVDKVGASRPYEELFNQPKKEDTL